MLQKQGGGVSEYLVGACQNNTSIQRIYRVKMPFLTDSYFTARMSSLPYAGDELHQSIFLMGNLDGAEEKESKLQRQIAFTAS